MSEKIGVELYFGRTPSLFRASCEASQRTLGLVAAADCVPSVRVSGVSAPTPA